MAKHSVLNNIEHKDLKVITKHSAALGDNIPNALSFVNEFTHAHKEYPLFLYKDPHTQVLRPVVMLGFDENLFLDEAASNNGWQARYVPAVMARGPFLIGFQNQERNGDEVAVPVINIDVEDPHVSLTEGEPIFLPMGGNTEYLNVVSNTLQIIHQGLSLNEAMIKAFTALDLIESVNLEIEFHNNQEYRISGYHTVNREKLYTLDAESLANLHSAGFLEAAFYMLSSLANIPVLIEMKNKRLAAEYRQK